MHNQKKRYCYRLILAAISGLLLTSAFPKFNFHLMIWISLIPLLKAVKDQSFKKGFFLGFFTGIIHYVTLLYWVTHSMKNYGNIPVSLCIVLLFILAAYLAIYTGLFAGFIGRCGHKPFGLLIIGPTLWTSLEYLRTHLFTGFPWGLLGYSQYKCLKIAQVSDIFGVYGVSALILLTNCMIFIIIDSLLEKRSKNVVVDMKLVGGMVAVLITVHTAVLSYGDWRINKTNQIIKKSPKQKIAVVQGNILQDEKWNVDYKFKNINKYIVLSKTIEKSNPDLIVWPETAIPANFSMNNVLIRYVLDAIKKSNHPFLVGCPSIRRLDEKIEFYNSAYLIDKNGRVKGKYDKFHLVPFGEYVPLRKWLPFIGKMVEQVGDFSTGKKGETIRLNEKARIGVQICIEIIYPELSRAVVKNNANLIVNLTNDAWFGETAGPYQHFSMIVFRAIENKVSVARSANTGISGFVLPTGKILKKTELFETKAIAEELPIIQSDTLYKRIGNVFGWGCLLIAIIYIPANIYYYKGEEK